MARIFKTPFGAQGDTEQVPEAPQGDGSVSLTQGFGYDYEREYEDPSAKDIRRGVMNGLFHDITEAIGDIQLTGIAKWSADAAPYPAGAVVWHGSVAWMSTAGNNSSEPGDGSGQWEELGDSDLRQDLANPDKGAVMVARGVIEVDSVAELLGLKPEQLRIGVLYSVASYYGAQDYLPNPYELGGGADFKWFPDSEAPENFGTVHAIPGREGPGRFHMVIRDSTTTSDQWGIQGDMTPQDRTRRMQSMWDWCAANKVRSWWNGRELHIGKYKSSTQALLVPSGLKFHCEPGLKLVMNYDPTVTSGYHRMISFVNARDVTGTGKIELDGREAGVPWYNEHSHGLFFYNSRRINLRGLQVIAYDIMADAISLSGGNNRDAFSEDVNIGSADLGRARRASLVVEAAISCSIGSLICRPMSSAAAITFEPFGVDTTSAGGKLSIRIDQATLYGSVNLVGGSNRARSNLSVMDFGSVDIIMPADRTGRAIGTWGGVMKCDHLTIDARSLPTTYENSLVHLGYSCTVSADRFDILLPDVFNGRVIYTRTTSSETNRAQTSQVDARVLSIQGAGDCVINNEGRLIVGTLIGDSDVPREFRIISRAADLSGEDMHILDIGSMIVKEPNGYVLYCYTYSTAQSALQKVGQISVYSAQAEAPYPYVLHCAPPVAQAALTLGGISIVGPRPENLLGAAPGGSFFYRTSGGKGSPSAYYRQGLTPEGIIPAEAGSTCTTHTGKLFVKAADSGLNTGWREITLMDAPAP